MDKLKQLQKYAGQGWQIFPCKPGEKVPLVKWKDLATSDSAKIAGWHQQHPKANWAVRTGTKKSGGSGFLVVDLDRHGDQDGIEQWEILTSQYEVEDMPTAKTGGGGIHFFFNQPDTLAMRSKGGGSSLAEGIDIKADASYVIIPPSETENEYIWDLDFDDVELPDVPAWLLNELKARLRRGAGATPLVDVEVIKQGGRHEAMKQELFRLRKTGITGDDLRTALFAFRDTRMETGADPFRDSGVDALIRWADEHPAPATYLYSDMGNGDRLVDSYGNVLRYSPVLKSWYSWDGRRWKDDASLTAMALAKKVVRGMLEEAV